MNGMLRPVAAATAVIVVAVVGISVLGPGLSGVGGGPSPTPTAMASPSSSPPGYTWPGPLVAGTYRTKFIWDIPFDLSLTVPDGWESRDIEVIKDPAGRTRSGGLTDLAISFTLVDTVYSDPCGHVTASPPTGPSVDDLAEALLDVPGLIAKAPTAATFDRNTTGQYIEFSVSEDIACDLLEFYLWELPEGSVRRDRGSVGPLIWPAEQRHHRVWILDVSGIRLAISAVWSEDATSADLAELQAVIDSIRIERPGATPPPEPSAR